MSQLEVVVIGICTCRRPAMLAACLDSLAKQIVPDGCSVHIVVVDNEEQPNARSAVEQFARDCPIPVSYVHEPKRGVPTARNASLDKAVALGADWIAFIDDDETAKADWLAELMSPSLRHIPVVAGRREFIYPSGRSFWEKPRRVAAKQQVSPPEPMRTASTCNVRFSRSLLDAGLRFDESLGLSGGSDELFFSEGHAIGFEIARAPLAITWELRHADRMSYFGIMRRHHSKHAGPLIQRRKSEGVLPFAARELPRATLNLLAGFAVLAVAPLGIVGGRRLFRKLALRGGKHLARACSFTAAFVGKSPEYYRIISGG
jgi:succinoglycan biosynthesis protein ExoM